MLGTLHWKKQSQNQRNLDNFSAGLLWFVEISLSEPTVWAVQCFFPQRGMELFRPDAPCREDFPNHFPLNVTIFHLVNNPYMEHLGMIYALWNFIRLQRLFNFRSGFSWRNPMALVAMLQKTTRRWQKAKRIDGLGRNPRSLRRRKWWKGRNSAKKCVEKSGWAPSKHQLDINGVVGFPWEMAEKNWVVVSSIF